MYNHCTKSIFNILQGRDCCPFGGQDCTLQNARPGTIPESDIVFCNSGDVENLADNLCGNGIVAKCGKPGARWPENGVNHRNMHRNAHFRDVMAMFGPYVPEKNASNVRCGGFMRLPAHGTIDAVFTGVGRR